jgi:precorrin-6B methylase 1
VNKHAPLKTHRIKKDHQPGWISPEILEAIKQRDQLKSVENLSEYRVWRNKVNKMIRQAKQAHYKIVLDENQNNPKAIWKVFTEFGAGKCKSKTEILSLNHEGIYTNNLKYF